MKIVSIVGARPQFIKESLIGKKLKEFGIDEVLVHSGQHYDFNMSDIFFKLLEIKNPQYNLGIGSGTHAEQTGRVMMEFEKILMNEKPSLVLTYGDTNTTLGGALTAAKLKRTKKRIAEFGLENIAKKIKIIDPVGYDESVALTSNAFSVVTDSGGLQKEAYFANVHGVVMMKDTGWIELVESGWNVLADADEEKIYNGVFNHPIPSEVGKIYGDGNASEKIAQIIRDMKL